MVLEYGSECGLPVLVGLQLVKGRLFFSIGR
jgi:hypothetical protein